MTTINVFVGDIKNEEHCKAMLNQLDLYRTDPMGGVSAMDDELAENVLKGLRKQPNFVFFLATSNGEYAGFANCFVNFSTFKAKPLINIHDIAVDPSYRGQGIGRALMDAIVEYAKQNDYCKITLEVRHDNPTAQQLYKSVGFTECQPPMYFWEKKLKN